MKKNKTIRFAAALSLAVIMAAATVSCDKKSQSTSTSGLTRVACDQSFENIMQQEVEVFEYIYPNASIMPAYLDEQACIDSLLNMGLSTPSSSPAS